MSARSDSRPQFSIPCYSIPCLLFPPLEWWGAALLAEKGSSISLETGSPRNGDMPHRYRIATANGAQMLSIPIKGGRRQRLPLDEQRIDYLHDWQRQHWGALYSAYGRAPYFEHYGDALKGIIYSGAETLEVLCRAGIGWLAKELRLEIDIVAEPANDALNLQPYDSSLPPYHQVFEARWGFIPNLSAVDLLMNEGPYGSEFLRTL